MSDTIIPISQKPIPCDFGPFAGGICYRKMDIKLDTTPPPVVTNPSLTVRAIVANVDTSTPKSINLNSSITVVDDKIIKYEVETPSEGSHTLSTTGIFVFTSNSTNHTDRTVIVNYTITTESGIVKSEKITLNIKYSSVFSKTIWYGNNVSSIMNEAILSEITGSKSQTIFAGNYPIPSGTGVYKWVIYPRLWGEPNAIIDANTLMNVSTDEFKYFTTADGVELIAIRTYYQVNGALTIKLI